MNLPQSPQGISRERAAGELLRRREARRSLISFTQYTYPQYKPDPMHYLIGSALEDVLEDRCDRLAIFAPPQTGKSELVSVRFPAFWLGRRPDDPVIVTSYGAELAVDKSKQARDLVGSDAYQRIFSDTQLREDSRAANRWKLIGHRGSMLAAGVDGPVTGNGGLLGIIDDPFANWKEAQSKTQRENVWEWWRGTFRTRIWDGGKVILICTRWHDDDLAGRLLKDQPGRWRILRIPMIAETQVERDANNAFLGLPAGESDPLGRAPGEVAAPSRFSTAAVLEIKTDVGSRVFAAEYQGVPRPPEGDRVKRGWFRIVGAAPRNARRVRYWDKAGSDNDGDYTVGLLMAECDGVYYIEDVVRGRWSVHERKRVMLQTAILDAQKYGKITWAEDLDDSVLSADSPAPIPGEDFTIEDPGPAIWIEQEGGSGGKDSVLEDIKYLGGFIARKHRPEGDKIVRAEPWIAQAEAGNLRIVNGSWNYAYLEEIVTVPNAANDDQWDATSGAFQKLRRGKVRLAIASVSK